MSSQSNPASSPRREKRLPFGELTLRIASSLVLAGIAMTLTWAGLWPFVLLVVICVAMLAWEWSRLLPGGNPTGDAAAIWGAITAAAILMGSGYTVAALVAVAGGAGAASILTRRQRTAAGLLYIGLPAVSVVAIRSDDTYGFEAVLFLLLVVWCSDIMAYIVGRLVGGPKLAPSISPGKTWSGCAAGLLFPALLAYFFARWTGGTLPAVLALVGAALALVAVIGDLIESALKRSAGVKDAGRLIPGHGGMLDRLDGFLFAAIGAGLLVLLRNADAPGRALLIWP